MTCLQNFFLIICPILIKEVTLTFFRSTHFFRVKNSQTLKKSVFTMFTARKNNDVFENQLIFGKKSRKMVDWCYFSPTNCQLMVLILKFNIRCPTYSILEEPHFSFDYVFTFLIWKTILVVLIFILKSLLIYISGIIQWNFDKTYFYTW